jgi:multidrug efflux pump subunit AcrA (membrane-fusion protein)
MRFRRNADGSIKLEMKTSLLLLVLILLGVGCGKEPASHSASSANLPAAAVRVQTVEFKTHLATEEVVGTVRAKLRAVLEAKVSGRIEKMRI